MKDRQKEKLTYTGRELGKYLKSLREKAGFTLVSISEEIHRLYPERSGSYIKSSYIRFIENDGWWPENTEGYDGRTKKRFEAMKKASDLYLKLVIKNKEQYNEVRRFLREIEKIRNEPKEEQRPNYDEKLLSLPIEVRKPLEELIDYLYEQHFK